MELAVPQVPVCSVQEYLRLAEESPTKLEFKSGQLIDMAGASLNHNRIGANILGELRNRLKGGPCEAIGGDTRVQAAEDRFCYPDVTVVCGDPTFSEFDPGSTVTNPHVIFEVLSPSTEATDRGEKFFRYIRVQSLREYFLVNQNRPRVESFVRQSDGSWAVGRVVEGLSASLGIGSLDVEIPMAEIYEKVRFETGNSIG